MFYQIYPLDLPHILLRRQKLNFSKSYTATTTTTTKTKEITTKEITKAATQKEFEIF